MKVSTVIKGGFHLSKLAFDVFLIWLAAGWKVRKAKKAFEKELLRTGMSKEAAKRLAEKYTSMKDEVTKQLWGSFRGLSRSKIHDFAERSE